MAPEFELTGLDADIRRFDVEVPVEMVDEDTEETICYQIVGEDEADIKVGMISITSPIARALIAKMEGDVVSVTVPGGERSLEIVDTLRPAPGKTKRDRELRFRPLRIRGQRAGGRRRGRRDRRSHRPA